MRYRCFQIIAISGLTGIINFLPTFGWAEDARPSQARVWDVFTRQAYLSGADGDWDGINDSEERLGKILWGNVTGVTANWYAGGENPSMVAAWTSSAPDNDVQPVLLPFAFPLGTQSWTQAWIGVNGTLGFGAAQASLLAQPLPALALGSNPFFAIFWDQLHLEPSAGGRVWTSSPGVGRFIVCWEHLQLGGETNSSISFQAELRQDGEMFWCYRELDTAGADVTNGVVGIQAEGSGWWLPSAILHSNLTLRVTSILALSSDNADTDGDGIIDGIELYYYQPDAANGRYLSPVRSDNPDDFDCDGLEVEQEYLYGRLNPFYWDTDGDMLSDGYEVNTRLLANNATGIHGLNGDADGDSLSNYLERLHRSQPRLADSDGDARSDALEIAMGSNPAGLGGVPSGVWLAPVQFTLGDPGLDGKTEAYAMMIDSLSGDTRGFTLQNIGYGVMQSQAFQLAIGGHYRLGLHHLGSVKSSAGAVDLDYEAGVVGVDGTVIAVTDASGMLGRHLTSSLIPAGTEPMNPNAFATVWVQSRVLPDGSVPVFDPVLTPRLSAWAPGRISTAGPVNASELQDPGVLVLPNYSAVMGSVLPTKIRFHGLGVESGCTRWLHFSNPSRISYQFSGMGTPLVPSGSEVQIPGFLSADADIDLRANGTWPIGTTLLVECMVKDATGQIVIARDGVRLIGQVVTALGDSLTFGFRRRANGDEETPHWNRPWLVYPSASVWSGFSGSWSDIAYQGFRGYLRRDLTTSVPWAGHPANGHGPDHCGYLGSYTTDITSTLGDTSRAYPSSAIQVGPSDLVVFYFIGINDVIAHRSARTIYSNWVQGINSILAKRSGYGRTLIVGVTLPKMSSRYFGYSSASQSELLAFNAKIRAHTLAAPYTRYVVADLENIRHDSDDDGLHFLSGGYDQIEQVYRKAILSGLKK